VEPPSDWQWHKTDRIFAEISVNVIFSRVISQPISSQIQKLQFCSLNTDGPVTERRNIQNCAVKKSYLRHVFAFIFPSGSAYNRHPKSAQCYYSVPNSVCIVSHASHWCRLFRVSTHYMPITWRHWDLRAATSLALTWDVGNAEISHESREWSMVIHTFYLSQTKTTQTGYFKLSL